MCVEGSSICSGSFSLCRLQRRIVLCLVHTELLDHCLGWLWRWVPTGSVGSRQALGVGLFSLSLPPLLSLFLSVSVSHSLSLSFFLYFLLSLSGHVLLRAHRRVILAPLLVMFLFGRSALKHKNIAYTHRPSFFPFQCCAYCSMQVCNAVDVCPCMQTYSCTS